MLKWTSSGRLHLDDTAEQKGVFTTGIYNSEPTEPISEDTVQREMQTRVGYLRTTNPNEQEIKPTGTGLQEETLQRHPPMVREVMVPREILVSGSGYNTPGVSTGTSWFHLKRRSISPTGSSIAPSVSSMKSEPNSPTRYGTKVPPFERTGGLVRNTSLSLSKLNGDDVRKRRNKERKGIFKRIKKIFRKGSFKENHADPHGSRVSITSISPVLQKKTSHTEANIDLSPDQSESQKSHIPKSRLGKLIESRKEQRQLMRSLKAKGDEINKHYVSNSKDYTDEYTKYDIDVNTTQPTSFLKRDERSGEHVSSQQDVWNTKPVADAVKPYTTVSSVQSRTTTFLREYETRDERSYKTHQNTFCRPYVLHEVIGDNSHVTSSSNACTHTIGAVDEREKQCCGETMNSLEPLVEELDIVSNFDDTASAVIKCESLQHPDTPIICGDLRKERSRHFSDNIMMRIPDDQNKTIHPKTNLEHVGVDNSIALNIKPRTKYQNPNMDTFKNVLNDQMCNERSGISGVTSYSSDDGNSSVKRSTFNTKNNNNGHAQFTFIESWVKQIESGRDQEPRETTLSTSCSFSQIERVDYKSKYSPIKRTYSEIMPDSKGTSHVKRIINNLEKQFLQQTSSPKFISDIADKTRVRVKNAHQNELKSPTVAKDRKDQSMCLGLYLRNSDRKFENHELFTDQLHDLTEQYPETENLHGKGGMDVSDKMSRQKNNDAHSDSKTQYFEGHDRLMTRDRTNEIDTRKQDPLIKHILGTKEEHISDKDKCLTHQEKELHLEPMHPKGLEMSPHVSDEEDLVSYLDLKSDTTTFMTDTNAECSEDSLLGSLSCDDNIVLNPEIERDFPLDDVKTNSTENTDHGRIVTDKDKDNNIENIEQTRIDSNTDRSVHHQPEETWNTEEQERCKPQIDKHEHGFERLAESISLSQNEKSYSPSANDIIALFEAIEVTQDSIFIQDFKTEEEDNLNSLVDCLVTIPNEVGDNTSYKGADTHHIDSDENIDGKIRRPNTCDHQHEGHTIELLSEIEPVKLEPAIGDFQKTSLETDQKSPKTDLVNDESKNTTPSERLATEGQDVVDDFIMPQCALYEYEDVTTGETKTVLKKKVSFKLDEPISSPQLSVESDDKAVMENVPCQPGSSPPDGGARGDQTQGQGQTSSPCQAVPKPADTGSTDVSVSMSDNSVNTKVSPAGTTVPTSTSADDVSWWGYDTTDEESFHAQLPVEDSTDNKISTILENPDVEESTMFGSRFLISELLHQNDNVPSKIEISLDQHGDPKRLVASYIVSNKEEQDIVEKIEPVLVEELTPSIQDVPPPSHNDVAEHWDRETIVSTEDWGQSNTVDVVGTNQLEETKERKISDNDNDSSATYAVLERMPNACAEQKSSLRTKQPTACTDSSVLDSGTENEWSSSVQSDKKLTPLQTIGTLPSEPTYEEDDSEYVTAQDFILEKSNVRPNTFIAIPPSPLLKYQEGFNDQKLSCPSSLESSNSSTADTWKHKCTNTTPHVTDSRPHSLYSSCKRKPSRLPVPSTKRITTDSRYRNHVKNTEDQIARYTNSYLKYSPGKTLKPMASSGTDTDNERHSFTSSSDHTLTSNARKLEFLKPKQGICTVSERDLPRSSNSEEELVYISPPNSRNRISKKDKFRKGKQTKSLYLDPMRKNDRFRYMDEAQIKCKLKSIKVKLLDNVSEDGSGDHFDSEDEKKGSVFGMTLPWDHLDHYKNKFIAYQELQCWPVYSSRDRKSPKKTNPGNRQRTDGAKQKSPHEKSAKSKMSSAHTADVEGAGNDPINQRRDESSKVSCWEGVCEDSNSEASLRQSSPSPTHVSQRERRDRPWRRPVSQPAVADLEQDGGTMYYRGQSSSPLSRNVQNTQMRHSSARDTFRPSSPRSRSRQSRPLGEPDRNEESRYTRGQPSSPIALSSVRDTCDLLQGNSQDNLHNLPRHRDPKQSSQTPYAMQSMSNDKDEDQVTPCLGSERTQWFFLATFFLLQLLLHAFYPR